MRSIHSRDRNETRLIDGEQSLSTHRQLVIGAAIILAAVALAAAWRWSPLGDWLEVSRLLAYVEEFRQRPHAPLLMIAGFLVGGLVMAPVTVLITVTVLAFGPIEGLIYSFIGMTSSAILTFVIGRLLGRRIVERISSRLHRVSLRLAENGVLAVVSVRVIPVAPFSVINVLAGATHIRTKDFVVGTIIGELPGLIGLSIFVDQITNTIRHPGPGSYAILAGLVFVIASLFWMLRRRLLARTEQKKSPGDEPVVSRRKDGLG
jgi:uncharacterized membrane protein YdjX (TVP38/TMEM64 family)